jgi:hypothetical protein
MPHVPESDTLAEALRVEEPPVRAWRVVEAQHRIASRRLVETPQAYSPDDQDLLERVLEEAKPPLARNTENLHYLLATPFRYPPHRHGSRFRAMQDPGVLYTALSRRTACAESGYWRWRFTRASEGLQGLPPLPQTMFQVGTRGPAIRLDVPPLVARSAEWTHPDDYSATQALARAARAVGAERIFYTSVRDREGGTCVAVLDPAALKPRKPIVQETWYLTVARSAVIWQRERERFVFSFDVS